MDLKRLTSGSWLIVAVSILAIASMIIVVSHATKGPATPEIAPQFSRSELEKSKGKGHSAPGTQPEQPNTKK